MLALVCALVGAARAVLRDRRSLVLENLVLRQQLAVLRARQRRVQVGTVDRLFWMVLSRLWARWAELLVLVTPETGVRWHRRGFRWYWARKSRRVGRPPVSPEVVELIQRMARDNPTWSRRRIASELALLGVDVSKDTVARYMASGGRPRPPSQSWKTFLRNHLAGTIAVDFLVVPTATFRMMYVFVVLALERRRVLHVHVTLHPTAAWTAQQIVHALGPDAPPVVRVIRDRDKIYGQVFDHRVNNLGLKQIRIAPRSPWQNGYVERFVGTMRRELLDHVVVVSERQLLRLVREHVAYYNEDRPHMSLAGNTPMRRRSQRRDEGRVIAMSRVGGLHHRYVRRAA